MYASLNRIASSIVAFTLLALVAHTLAGLLWGLYDSQLTGIQQTPVESNNPEPELSLSDLPINFFSTAPSSTATAQPKLDLDKIDKTQLRLTLKGVLATPNNAVVIIENNNKQESTYSIDEEIQPGVTLKAIYSTWVLIDNQGKSESLLLPGSDKKALPKSTIEKDSDTEFRDEILTSEQQRKLSKYMQKLKTNPMSLTEQVQVSPFYKNDELIGFEIKPGKEPEIFAKLGFKTRDIITEINGVKFDSMIAASFKAPSLVNADSFNIKLIRNNQTQALTVDLK